GFLKSFSTIRAVVADCPILGNVKITSWESWHLDTVQNFGNFLPRVVLCINRKTFHQIWPSEQQTSSNERTLQKLATIIHDRFSRILQEKVTGPHTCHPIYKTAILQNENLTAACSVLGSTAWLWIFPKVEVLLRLATGLPRTT